MNILHFPKHIRVVVLYIIIGGLWVLIADYAIMTFTKDPEQIIKLKQYRGFAFIGITAVVLYFERKHADETRKKAEELERMHIEKMAHADKMVTLGTLVSGVAHEINNPTNFITLNTPILREFWQGTRPILDEYYQKEGNFSVGRFQYSALRGRMDQLLDGVTEGAERITRIVAHLKDFARPDPSDMNQEVDINRAIQNAVALLGNPIEKHTRHFHVAYDDPIPPIIGSAQKLEQVMINLIQNSLESLTDGEQGVFVSSKCDKESNGILIEVKDEGCGIAEEILSRILDPFFTTKRTSGGTGLGLPIVARIVKDHGGEITFSSEVGRGTTATIRLPGKEKP